MKRLQTNAPLRPPASSGPIPDERAAGHSEVTSATDRRLRLACHSLGSRCGSIAWRGPAHRQAAHIDGKSPDRRRRSIARTPPSVDWRPKPLPNMKFRSRAAARLRVPIPGDGLRSSTPVAPAQGSNLSRERTAAARPGDSRSRSWTRAPTDRAAGTHRRDNLNRPVGFSDAPEVATDSNRPSTQTAIRIRTRAVPWPDRVARRSPDRSEAATAPPRRRDRTPAPLR